MTTIQTIHQYRCDLNKGPSEVTLKAPIMHQDALGDVFRVSVWNGSKSVSLNGMTVRGYLYFATTRQTLLVDGSIVDGFASVALTSECYAIPGYASLVVQVQDGNVRHSLLKVNMNITRTCSDSVIDPGNVLPTLPELLGQISAMEQATDKANATIATVKADTAAAIKTTNEATAAANTATVELAKTAAPAITPTVKDSLVTITDGADRPAVQVLSHIEPVQAGSGDPSPDNVRPISGWDKVTAQRTGGNIYPGSDLAFTTSQYVALSTPLPPGTYTVSALVTSSDTDANTCSVVFTDEEKQSNTFFALNRDVNSAVTHYCDKPTYGFQFYASTYYGGSANDECSWANIMINAGETALSYEPYQGQTLTASLPETVYGGKVDWTTGVLTVSHVIQTFTSDDALTKADGYSHVFNYRHKGVYVGGEGLSSHFIYTGSHDDVKYSFHVSNGSIYFSIASCETPEQALEWLINNNVKVCARLTTPYTIQLTPQQLNTLKGTNNVWSDTGDTELTYIADTQLYINQKLAAIAAASL